MVVNKCYNNIMYNNITFYLTEAPSSTGLYGCSGWSLINDHPVQNRSTTPNLVARGNCHSHISEVPVWIGKVWQRSQSIRSWTPTSRRITQTSGGPYKQMWCSNQHTWLFATTTINTKNISVIKPCKWPQLPRVLNCRILGLRMFICLFICSTPWLAFWFPQMTGLQIITQMVNIPMNVFWLN